MGDDMVELFTANESLKTKLGSRDERWLEEMEAKLLKQFVEEKMANLFMTRMEKNEKQYKRVQKHSLAFFRTKKWLLCVRTNFREVSFTLMSLQQIEFKI